MYKCDVCKNCTQPREALKKIVVARRNKEYYTATLKHRRNNNKLIITHRPTVIELDMWKRENLELMSEKTTNGWEIALEHKLCDECYQRYLIEQEKNKVI